MANSTKTPVTPIQALINEGKALGSIWRQTNSMKQTIKDNGFDTRLGKLLVTLKADTDGPKIPTHVLRTHGIDGIDRRRRSEALWFIENETECRAFIAESKFKGNSLTSLQNAMRQAVKDSDTDETDSEAELSNVGQSDETPSKPKVTQTVMVNTILQHVEANKLNLESVIEELISHVAKRNTKVAA